MTTFSTFSQTFSIEKLPSLDGKTAVVTGASAGIGREIALELARKNCHVLLACRNETKTNTVIAEIKQATGNSQVEFLECDLADMKSVDKAAKSIIKRLKGINKGLNILINNAGLAIEYGLTKDNLETMFQANHLGHFHLTLSLLPLLISTGTPDSPSRISNTASDAYQWAYKKGLDWDRLENPDPAKFHSFLAYGQTKLCNIYFSQELARRLKTMKGGENVIVAAVHPGFVKSDFPQNMGRIFGDMVGSYGLYGVFWVLQSILAIDSPKGALCSLYTVTSPDLVEKKWNGRYFVPLGLHTELPAWAKDPTEAGKLWELSAQLVKDKMLEAPLPVIDMSRYLSNPTGSEANDDCHRVAEALTKFSALTIRDPRVHEGENDAFLDLMERYFAQPREVKLRDARPEHGFQVGVTPGGQETPKCGGDAGCLDFVSKLSVANRPHPFAAADPKWRFFHSLKEASPKAASSEFEQINPPPVVPAGFPEWQRVTDSWGLLMKSAVEVVAEMAAVGLGLDKDAFTRRGKYGSHLLAPTGSDLGEFGTPGTVLAGFHYDLNFLTIHGKSRYPGLFVWPKNANKLAVKIPQGCLLVQAGKQLEWMTGGLVTAGYHEVVVTPDTVKAMDKRKRTLPDGPQWRISSTVFYHIASDETLQPLPPFDSETARKLYPAILAGNMVKMELGLIGLLEGQAKPDTSSVHGS